MGLKKAQFVKQGAKVLKGHSKMHRSNRINDSNLTSNAQRER
jgi:hypothetical protein